MNSEPTPLHPEGDTRSTFCCCSKVVNAATARAAATFLICPLTIFFGLASLPAYAQQGSRTSSASIPDRKSSGSIAAPERRILVAGDPENNIPPLTEAMVEKIAGYVTFCFDFPLTAADRDRFRSVLMGEWQRRDPKAIAGNLEMLKAADYLARLSPLEREVFRQKALPEGVADARKRAKEDPDMRWLVSRYDETHRPLAMGQPPLTRQATDAFAELACFMAGEARGQKLIPTSEFKDSIAAFLVKQWASLSAEGRKELAAMPFTLAQLRYAWPDAPAAQKEQLRAQWRKQFGDGTQTAARTASAPNGLNAALPADVPYSGAPRWTEAERTAQAAWSEAVWTTKDQELIPIPRTTKLLDEAQEAEQSAVKERDRGNHPSAARYEAEARRLREVAALPPGKRPRITRRKLLASPLTVPVEYRSAYWWIKNHDMYELQRALTREQNKHIGNMGILGTYRSIL
jgi:hypothetical protein